VKLSEILKAELIFLDISAGDKQEVIRFLAGQMIRVDEVTDGDMLLADILKRESEIPTGIEFGCAIPHARSEAVSHLVLAFARMKEGVDFGSPDGSKSKLIFQFGVPSDQISLYLKMLAKLSRLLKAGNLRSKLLNAENQDDVLQAFAGK
jgi:fructose-specific phosphotransferase system IIA component